MNNIAMCEAFALNINKKKKEREMENILRERTDIAHLFGMWKLLNSSTQHGVKMINLNFISFFFCLPGRIL